VNGIGGKSNLIVDNDMNGAANMKIGNVGQLHGFIHNALSSKGGIAV
jgi:hypothetical protein